MPRTAFLATLGAALLVASPVAAQVGSAPPNSYALTNVRIVAAPGRVIERGTVVIRNGRIAEVGAQVTAPADVQRFDLNGMTVYPGLIDPAATIGLPRAQPQQGGRGQPAQQQGGRASGRGSDVPEIQPTRTVADVASLQDTDLETLRSVGITVAQLAFDAAIIGGQNAIVSLRTTSVDSALLRTPSAVQVGMETRRGGYPSTIMGTVAYLEQAFSDAAYQQRVADAFEKNPGSGPRPVYDADRSALAPAVAKKIPVVMNASRESDLRRSVALAKRMNVDYVLLGTQEGYRAVDVLTKEARPVIVSFNYPRVDQVTGRAFELHVSPISGRDSIKISADSTVAKQLRGNAAALVKAGVPVAFTTYGLERATDLRERVRGAIEAGLSADEALRALTLTPAKILGLERVAGSIEPGKLANLVVTEGDLFDRNGHVRHVFVEGQHFIVREQENQGRGGRGGRGGQPGGVR
jgi:imidazolonepropionase-like amidohydrolase